jgi:peptidoglycan/xylan/chitin deacetylase (PgdA/CDA1 family)
MIRAPFATLGVLMTACFLMPRLSVALLALVAAGAVLGAEQRQIAITIDDLPRGGDAATYDAAGVSEMTQRLLRPFREQKVPLIGFVNAGRSKVDSAQLHALLDMWVDAGAELGNHTYSHLDINKVSLDTYTDDIARGEEAIRAVLSPRGKTLEFYRHPYLHAGPKPEIKKGLQEFLERRAYRVAPVTVDNMDYGFAVAYLRQDLRAQVEREYVPYMESVVAFFEQRSVEVFGREIPQVLLIHASQMNADLMPSLLDMLRRRGYEFVTLRRALEDPAYQAPETYVGPGGFSWMHRWSMTKGMESKGEPEPPEWVTKAFEAR